MIHHAVMNLLICVFSCIVSHDSSLFVGCETSLTFSLLRATGRGDFFLFLKQHEKLRPK